MEDYEYKVIPAPERTVKVKGLKTPGERFAHLLAECLNEAANEGWEYVRAESLPCEERKGLFSKAKSTQVVLIFRRALDYDEPQMESPVDSPAEVFHHAEPDARHAPEPPHRYAEAPDSAPSPAGQSAHPIPRFRAEPALGRAQGMGDSSSRREPTLRARQFDEPGNEDERHGR